MLHGGEIYDQWVFDYLDLTKEDCGFLSIQENYGPKYFKAPTKNQDLKDYIRALKRWNETEFQELYGEYAPMIEKYHLMKLFMDKLNGK